MEHEENEIHTNAMNLVSLHPSSELSHKYDHRDLAETVPRP